MITATLPFNRDPMVQRDRQDEAIAIIRRLFRGERRHGFSFPHNLRANASKRGLRLAAIRRRDQVELLGD